MQHVFSYFTMQISCQRPCRWLTKEVQRTATCWSEIRGQDWNKGWFKSDWVGGDKDENTLACKILYATMTIRDFLPLYTLLWHYMYTYITVYCWIKFCKTKEVHGYLGNSNKLNTVDSICHRTNKTQRVTMLFISVPLMIRGDLDTKEGPCGFCFSSKAILCT